MQKQPWSQMMAQIGKALHAGEKSGFYSAEVKYFRRRDFRKNLQALEPEQVIVTTKGIFYFPGGGSKSCDWMNIEENLTEDLKKELFEMTDYLEKSYFTVRDMKVRENDISMLMKRGSVVVELNYSTDVIGFPITIIPLVDRPKLCSAKRAKLNYMVYAGPEMNEEEKLLAAGIGVVFKQVHGLE